MRRVLIGAAALVVLAACAAGAYWLSLPSWPDFPASQELKPQSKVTVARDYAYRIGDVIPVEVVLRQQLGTRIELPTATVSGDFELPEKPILEQKELEGGAVLYRLRFKLQSFEPKPRLSFTLSVSWTDLAKNEQLVYQTKETKLGTGMTWDGRAEMQEGDEGTGMLMAWLRALVPLVLGSVLFLFFLTRAVLAWWWSRRQLSDAERIRNRFQELLGTVRSGTCSRGGYCELEAIVRKRWGVESVPVDRVRESVSEADWKETVAQFLTLTATAIYPEEAPSEEDIARIPVLGDSLAAGLIPGAKPPGAPAVLPSPPAVQPEQSTVQPAEQPQPGGDAGPPGASKPEDAKE